MILALTYLGLSFQLNFGQLDRPGEGVFPVMVGIVLVLASLLTLWEGWQLDKGQMIDIPVGADRNRLLGLIVLLFCYFIALPLLGQIVASTLFCALLMRLLSNRSWPQILAYSLGMSILLYFSFVELLQVPLPKGILAF